MANGGGPPDLILRNADYDLIKDGELITSGSYEGCVLDNGTYYWVQPFDEEYWELKTGLPDGNICKITEAIWKKCCNGGLLLWLESSEQWMDEKTDKFYRWGGTAADPVVLVEVKK